jgi:hypothetical protein
MALAKVRVHLAREYRNIIRGGRTVVEKAYFDAQRGCDDEGVRRRRLRHNTETNSWLKWSHRVLGRVFQVGRSLVDAGYKLTHG